MDKTGELTSFDDEEPDHSMDDDSPTRCLACNYEGNHSDFNINYWKNFAE